MGKKKRASSARAIDAKAPLAGDGEKEKRRAGELVEPLLRVESHRDAVRACLLWQQEHLELFEGTALSTPRRRHFSSGRLIIVALQSGSANNEYRNSRTNDQGRDGVFRVFEPEEAWNCQPIGVSFQSLSVESRWLQAFAEATLHREKPLPHFANGSLFDRAFTAALRSIAGASRSCVSRLEQEELLVRLFAPLLLRHGEKGGSFPRSGREHPAARRAKEFLQAHYTEEVPLQALAKVAAMSPFHLTRVFRDAVGLPPHAYQTQLRLAHARKLLAQGHDVGHVAQRVGFFDQSHLAHHFRRYFFVKPSRYAGGSIHLRGASPLGD